MTVRTNKDGVVAMAKASYTNHYVTARGHMVYGFDPAIISVIAAAIIDVIKQITECQMMRENDQAQLLSASETATSCCDFIDNSLATDGRRFKNILRRAIFRRAWEDGEYMSRGEAKGFADGMIADWNMQDSTTKRELFECPCCAKVSSEDITASGIVKE